tara:strand:+ start:270 stop:578 length:309 start_codon:yes stop_codon:yes gene_type:complete
MRKKELLICISICLLWSFTLAQTTSDSSSGFIKIALRDGANQLLLSVGGSTSLIFPVKELSDGKFQVSFERETGFRPNYIVDTFKERFQKANIQIDYLIEVR